MMDSNEGSEWTDLLRRISNDDPNITSLDIDEMAAIDETSIENMTDENWEQLGRNISNNNHMKKVDISFGWLNDHKMSFLFRGLTRSSSIDYMQLYGNGLSAAGVRTMVRSMVPFLQNANNLTHLSLESNNMQSEGFNLLLRALRDSQVEKLDCSSCDIDSIEIDKDNKPKHLKKLILDGNYINADGCRGLVKLLQGGDATLDHLNLVDNKIDDEGVEILTNALRSNTSLTELLLHMNDGISQQGEIMLLKLVGDVSSVEATLQSNHTLRKITFPSSYTNSQIRKLIKMATEINRLPEEEVNRAKVIETQLNSKSRAKFATLQGVEQSLYSEINPLHLPEVLALVGRHHGQGELYMAVKLSITGVISIVNERECLEQERSHYRAIIAEYTNKLDAVEAKIATIDAAEAPVVDIGSEFRSNKRRRKWWWGLWGGT